MNFHYALEQSTKVVQIYANLDAPFVHVYRFIKYHPNLGTTSRDTDFEGHVFEGHKGQTEGC